MVEQYWFGNSKMVQSIKKTSATKNCVFCGDEIAKSFPFFIASKMSNDKQQKNRIFFYCVAL
jgi:hypothetical protein